MKRLLPLLLLLGACVDQSKLPPEVRGKGAFAAYNCQRCHRVGYEGGGEAGPDLTYVGFRKSAEFLAEWLRDPSAWQPNTLMPNFQLTEQGRKDIAAYLATLKGSHYRQDKPAPWQTPAARAEPKLMGELLFAHLGCVTCHGKKGVGGYPNNNVKGGVVPNLTQVADTYSKAELIEKIKIGVRRPAKADPEGPEPYLWMPAWGEVLNAEELEALAEILLHWSREAGAGGGDSW